jgi:hypothetical protein
MEPVGECAYRQLWDVNLGRMKLEDPPEKEAIKEKSYRL